MEARGWHGEKKQSELCEHSACAVHRDADPTSAALVGIQVEVREESYTSQASFLDLDPIPTYTPDDEEEHVFSGKRIGRRNRLYRAKDGKFIGADVNGAYNILRKSRPDAFSQAKGVAGYVVHPLRLAV